MEAADRGRPGPRAHRRRPCSRATRRRCSSTATSTATRRRAPTPIMRVIEQWATSTDPAVETLLQRNRIIFNVTSNPDGRVANTRANAAGYDLNRDLTILSQPESRLIRDLIVETKPIITLDLHGYVNPTLMHPSTPPHNVNNEYDLYIKHGLPNALNIEQGIAPSATRRSRARGSRSVTTSRACGTTSRRSTCRRSRCCRAASRTRSRRRPAAAPAPTRRAPRGHRHRRPRGRDQDLAEVHPGQPQPGHLRPGRGLPPRLGGRAAARHPGRLRPGLGPGGQVHDHVPALVRDPGRRAPALRRRRPSASSTC